MFHFTSLRSHSLQMETLEDLGRFTWQDLGMTHVFVLGKSEMENARPLVPA